MEQESPTETNTDSAAGSTSQRNWMLWLLAVLLVLLYAPTILWLLDRWTMSVWHNGHGILITLVVGYLVWKELEKLQHLPTSSSPLGFAILIPALLLFILDTGIDSQLLGAAALVLSLPGLALIFLGRERTRAILFPLLALFLTLPIPLAFTESIHLILRHIATDAVAWLCSGFSTLYATITVAVLTAYFCASIPRRIAVLLVAVPLAIGVNIVRVLVLTLLVHWVGLDVLETSAHEISGMLTFVVALPIVFWLGRNPDRSEVKS